MSSEYLINEYMSQTDCYYASSEHDAHNNGSTHINSSGHHADSGQTSGGGHGNYYDSTLNI